jgi:general secretion pathway protein G
MSTGKGFKLGFGIGLGVIAAILLVIFVGGFGIGFFGSMVQSDAEKRAIAKSQIELIQLSLQSFKLHNNRFPTTDEGFDVLRNNPKYVVYIPDGPKDIFVDPWGNQFVYEAKYKGLGYSLLCLGADGEIDGIGEDEDIYILPKY